MHHSGNVWWWNTKLAIQPKDLMDSTLRAPSQQCDLWVIFVKIATPVNDLLAHLFRKVWRHGARYLLSPVTFTHNKYQQTIIFEISLAVWHARDCRAKWIVNTFQSEGLSKFLRTHVSVNQQLCTVGIRLAGHTFGDFQRWMAIFNDAPRSLYFSISDCRW